MDETKHKDIDGIYPLTDSVQVQTVNASDPEALKQRDGRIHDEVFGELGEGRVNYRGLTFWSAVVVMVKTNIGLGVLSIPFLFQVVGLVPGVIMFLAVAALITWCTYQIQGFKLAHPDIYAIDDIGYIFGGKLGREVIAVSMVLFYVACSGSGILALSVAFNAMSTHGTCTAILVAVSAILVFIGCSVRTLARLSWLGYAGAVSIGAAVLTLLIAVGVNNRPALAPQEGPFEKIVHVTAQPTFAEAASVIGGIMFTLAGTPAFFPIISEMRDPRQYGKAFFTCQSIIISIDVMVGIVVYWYCGQYVASPAPGSAGVLMKKVVYGIAFPGILFSSLIFNHYAAKYIYVRLRRNAEDMAANTTKNWTIWLSCTAGCTLVSYVLCSGVPIFGPLSSLIGSLFGPLVSLIPCGLMWLHMNWRRRNDGGLYIKAHIAFAVLVVLLGFFMLVSGTYGSIVDIKTAFDGGHLSKPWSCADNSNSVKSS